MDARRGGRRDPQPRGKGQGGRRRRRGLLAANDDWSERAEDNEDGGLRLEGGFLKDGRRTHPSEEEEVTGSGVDG